MKISANIVHARLTEEQDRRIKVTKTQRQEIKNARENGERRKDLAEKYNVSTSTIYLCCNPDQRKKANERANWYGKANYANNRDRIIANSRKSQIYKKKLYELGELRL